MLILWETNFGFTGIILPEAIDKGIPPLPAPPRVQKIKLALLMKLEKPK